MDGLIKATRSESNAMYFHRKCSVDEQNWVCMSLAESVLNLSATASTILTETAHYLMFNRMVMVTVPVIQSLKGRFRTFRKLSYCNTNGTFSFGI